MTYLPILAVWAIKTALMCEFMHSESRGATDELFRAFYDSGLRPPPSAHVWLGRYIGQKDMDYNHRDLLVPESPDGSIPGRKGYLTAFIINRLVLYVMDVETRGVATQRADLSEQAQRRTLPIQPIKYAMVRWPPEFGTDDEGIAREVGHRCRS